MMKAILFAVAVGSAASGASAAPLLNQAQPSPVRPHLPRR